MLTSKQRAKLRSIATTTETILQIGKGGIGEQLVTQVNDALEARELIKLHVLETAPKTGNELSAELAAATHSEVVQIIGKRIVLYRRNAKNPVIDMTDSPEKLIKAAKPKKAVKPGKPKWLDKARAAGKPKWLDRTSQEDRPGRTDRTRPSGGARPAGRSGQTGRAARPYNPAGTGRKAK